MFRSFPQMPRAAVLAATAGSSQRVARNATTLTMALTRRESCTLPGGRRASRTAGAARPASASSVSCVLRLGMLLLLALLHGPVEVHWRAEVAAGVIWLPCLGVEPRC